MSDSQSDSLTVGLTVGWLPAEGAQSGAVTDELPFAVALLPGEDCAAAVDTAALHRCHHILRLRKQI